MSTYCIIPNVVLYGGAACLAILGRWFAHPQLRAWILRCFWGGLLLHTGFLVWRTMELGVPFLLGHEAAMGVVTWTIAVVFAILARTPRWQSVSPYFLPIVFLLFVQSIVLGQASAVVRKIATAPWLIPAHLTISMVAVALCLMGLVVGALWLVAHRQFKSRRPTPFWLIAPSLPTLERTLTGLLTAGFITLGGTLISGLFLQWEVVTHGKASYHQWGALAAWVIYGVILPTRFLGNHLGRKAILLSCLGFGAVLFALVEVHAR